MLPSGIDIIFEGQNFPRILEGLWVTVKIALISIGLSVVFGIIMGILMSSKNMLIRAICKLYLETIRIIPILVWLFIFYFIIAKQFNIRLDATTTSILVFTLWGTAEMGDLVRGAITSLPVSQRQSAMALGLNNTQIYLYVIIPQAARRLVPAAINLATRMIKTTPLIYMIGIIEVVKVGQQIIESSVLTNHLAPFWIYGFIFILYFIVCYPISLVSKKLEEKWQA